MIGGGNVTGGYWNRPELTAERFLEIAGIEGPAYRTGDLVQYDRDGELRFLGRIDHQVKIRGHRIELGEVEATLGAHPQVREVAVTVTTGPSGDSRLRSVLRHDRGRGTDAGRSSGLGRGEAA